MTKEARRFVTDLDIREDQARRMARDRAELVRAGKVRDFHMIK